MDAGGSFDPDAVRGDGGADLVTGTDSGTLAHVKVFQGGSPERSLLPYGSFTGGVRVATGDVDGDGFSDMITSTGSGAPHVKVFSGRTGSEIASFLAYGGFSGGVFVAAGDLDGDGRADIIDRRR